MIQAKHDLQLALAAALAELAPDAATAAPAAAFESPKQAAHGDLAITAAMSLAKALKTNPRELAARLVALLQRQPAVQRWVQGLDIAGPGFINLRLTPAARQAVVAEVLAAGERFGAQPGTGAKVMVEFVSANPTGPLHVGHGRNAALGDAIARLLQSQGADVVREFYYNDAGAQIRTLGISTQCRLRGLRPGEDGWPEQAYNGDYIADIAAGFAARQTVRADDRAFTASGDADDLDGITQFAVAWLRHEQDLDLQAFGVRFDNYYLESSLYSSGRVDDTVRRLVAAGKTYEKDGALWLRSTDYGDDKDRVMRKSAPAAADPDGRKSAPAAADPDGRKSAPAAADPDGRKSAPAAADPDGRKSAPAAADPDGRKSAPAAADADARKAAPAEPVYTYFVPDVAYHIAKFERGFRQVINVQGSDHHGTVARVRAGLQAANAGIPGGYPDYVLYKMITVMKGGQEVKISKRSGGYVTLRELIDWTSRDAVRFFLASRKADTEFTFDIDLALQANDENPVFYVQYAHARICSVLAAWGGDRAALADADLSLLVAPTESTLMLQLADFPSMLQRAAASLAPHDVAFYLRSLAADFHGYYAAERFLVDDAALSRARMALLAATAQVLRNALALLGVSAPEAMHRAAAGDGGGGGGGGGEGPTAAAAADDDVAAAARQRAGGGAPSAPRALEGA